MFPCGAWRLIVGCRPAGYLVHFGHYGNLREFFRTLGTRLSLQKASKDNGME